MVRDDYVTPLVPGIDRFSLAFEFGLKRIGKRQIHVVAAQLAYADAFRL
jgi:hypothetical protein